MGKMIPAWPWWCLVAIMVLVIMTGCTTTGGSFCSIAKPIRLSSAAIAAMSDREVTDTLAHNRKGEALCRWKQ